MEPTAEATATPSHGTSSFYEVWARLGWPASYGGKLFLGGLVCTVGPVAAALWGLPRWVPTAPSAAAWALGLGLAASLFGLLLRSLLAPLYETEAALTHYLQSGERLPLADGMTDEAGRVRHRIAYLLEHVAQRGELLGQLATTDYVTGLPNQPSALERLRHARDLALRDHLPLTAALLDVDGLFGLNEEHGYQLGDQLLRGVAQRLGQQLRGSDWAARWGDDEFLLVLFADADGATNAIARIYTDLESLRVVAGGHEIRWRGTLAAAQIRDEERLGAWLERVAGELATAMANGEPIRIAD